MPARHHVFGSTLLGLGSIAISALVLVIAPGSADARGGRDCHRGLKHRTPQQTILDHVALIQEGRLDEAMCNFAPDAAIILPGQVVTGLDNIRAGLEGIGGLLGGAAPEIRTLTTHGSTVLLTFSAFGTPCTIPDGSDTYIVRKGQIVAQTVHDTFYHAPGAVCPLAAPVP